MWESGRAHSFFIMLLSEAKQTWVDKGDNPYVGIWSVQINLLTHKDHIKTTLCLNFMQNSTIFLN